MVGCWEFVPIVILQEMGSRLSDRPSGMHGCITAHRMTPVFEDLGYWEAREGPVCTRPSPRPGLVGSLRHCSAHCPPPDSSSSEDHRYNRLRGSISTRVSIERSEKERSSLFNLVGCTLSLLRRNELGTVVADSIPRHRVLQRSTTEYNNPALVRTKS
jgi:hypothetical protein